MVYIPFFISHVPPAHSFFKKASILKNLCQICGNLFFAAYLFKFAHPISNAQREMPHRLFNPGDTPEAAQRHPEAPGDTQRHHSGGLCDKPGKTGTPQQRELFRFGEKPLHTLQVTVSIFLKNCELYHGDMYWKSE